MKIKSNKEIAIDWTISFLMITIGTIMASLSLEAFLVPNLIIDGGITGISIMLSHVTGIQLSFIIIVLNIPLLILGFKHLGKGFLLKACYAMVLFSVLLSKLQYLNEVTDDKFLATLFGGILLGIGVGFVIRYGGCLDGTESVAILLSKNNSFSVGQVVLCFNIVIYGVSGFLFGWDRAMYSLATYLITYMLIDKVVEGMEQVKSAMIITDHGEDIANAIYKNLGRTVTTLEAEGFITGKKMVLYCVITRMEISELKRIIDESDDSSFVTITDVAEIIGKHIKKNILQKKPVKKEGLPISTEVYNVDINKNVNNDSIKEDIDNVSLSNINDDFDEEDIYLHIN